MHRLSEWCPKRKTTRHGNETEWGRVLPSSSSIILPYTYQLPYSFPTGMRNLVTSSSPTGSSIPDPSPSLHWIFFFKIIIKVFFNSERNIVMHYPTKRWWWSMTMVIEKREAGSVRYRRRKERTIISECHVKTETLTVLVKWFRFELLFI